MLVFDPFVLLFWIFLSAFLPGAIFSLSLLKNTELNKTEKILVGFGIGLILPQVLPMLLLIAGIKYSFGVAVLGVLVFYAIAIALFIKEKPFELKAPGKIIEIPKEPENLLKQYGLQFFLILLLIVSFWIRLQSYSPIFQELDPYYYTYLPQQIITLGENPFDDKTAWYPDLKVTHRDVPILAYMESLWYELYTGGKGAYDNMLLSTISSIYPPIAAAIAVFFLYLLFASQYKREYALIGAAVAAFIPIFIMKTVAGEMEIQPYAFFSLSFFFASYAFAVKQKELKNAIPFIIATIIAFIGLIGGAHSSSIAVTALLLFIPLHAIMLYLKSEDEHLKNFAFINGWIILGMYVYNGFQNLYLSQNPGISVLLPGTMMILIGMMTIFAYALYALKQRVSDSETRTYALAGIIIAGLIIFLFTPLNQYVADYARGTVVIAKYTQPLHRTIAEQGTTGSLLQNMLGFFGAPPDEIANQIGFGIEPLKQALAFILNLVFLPFTIVSNLFFKVFASLLNTAFQTGLEYSDKETSLIMVSIAFILLGLCISLLRSIRKEPTLFILFAAIIFPLAIVGILKAKYTIYVGYFFAGALAIVLGEGEIGLTALAKRTLSGETLNQALKAIPAILIIMGLLMVGFQITHEGFATSLLSNSAKTRFQDNPILQKSKLTLICNQLKLGGQTDARICEAAADPVAFASKGTNYQYDSVLCQISIANDPFKITDAEKIAGQYRCQRIADYWIDSMEWIRKNTESDSRTTSWWDYGHWINFFGQKNTVLRNEHASLYLIGEVAHAYIDGSTDELIEFMNAHDSKYALFDGELLLSGSMLGGKYGALNYLSCARDNETNVNNSPGTSECEFNHLWEMIYVPKGESNIQACTISSTSGKKGVLAYSPTPHTDAVGKLSTTLEPKYCIGEASLADGQKITATYDLNQKYPNGDLKLNKALMKYDYETSDQVAVFTLLYTKDRIWIENGQIVDGYGDRKTKFYDSNLYKAFFLEDLPGFQLVYSSGGDEVKIYKLVE